MAGAPMAGAPMAGAPKAGAVPEVSRNQVLAYRVAAHELDRAKSSAHDLAVLDLGVQDTPYGSAWLALAARMASPVPEDRLALVWSIRGAPHLHRRAGLATLAAALWPLSDADATARIADSHIKEGARFGMAAFTAVARAMRAVVGGIDGKPLAKGVVSAAVSSQVPAALTYWCKGCQAQHISGGLFQQAGLPAGVQLASPELAPGAQGSGSRPATRLAPIGGWPGVPAVAAGTGSVIATYLRLLGPATRAEVAKFLGTTQAEVRRAWPDGLAEIRVDGRRAWLPGDRVDALRSATAPRLVRMLPPADPFLQARDRGLLVPDRSRQAAVWQILANPGALLVDSEVAGIWRARLAGKHRLDITVTPFEALDSAARAAVETEAGHVAAARGAADFRVLLASE
ncbi:MAG TPA: crosslink repair DNA glycosylase YcaQ family protein [Streptosporangiaceae bacterium]|nr:crosslink repair DNA glycosylase YcaQ family protein [Streptosporangiaceae bacterium]